MAKSPAAASEPQASPAPETPRQATVQWIDKNMATHFANVVNVQSTREQVDLFFGTNQTWNVGGGGQVAVDLSNRIILTPFAAKRLWTVLGGVLREYESQARQPRGRTVTDVARGTQKPNARWTNQRTTRARTSDSGRRVVPRPMPITSVHRVRSLAGAGALETPRRRQGHRRCRPCLARFAMPDDRGRDPRDHPLGGQRSRIASTQSASGRKAREDCPALAEVAEVALARTAQSLPPPTARRQSMAPAPYTSPFRSCLASETSGRRCRHFGTWQPRGRRPGTPCVNCNGVRPGSAIGFGKSAATSSSDCLLGRAQL